RDWSSDVCSSDLRTPPDLDGIEPARYLDHRGPPGRTGEMLGEARGIDRGRGDHDLEVVTPGPLHELAQVAEQEVDVEAALVRLVDDQGVVLREQRIRLRLGEADPGRHQLAHRPVRQG